MISRNSFKNYYSSYLTLVGIVLVALGFRIFLFRYRYAIGFDEPHYLQLAASALFYDFKDILHPHWSPMYPIFIAGMSLLVKNFELAGRLVSAISGSLVILPVFFLTQNLFGKKTAYLSAILIACYPPLAFMSTDVLTESTYMLLSISGIAIGWLALERHSKILGLVTGLLFGLSYLTRPEGIGWLIVFLGWGMLLVLFNLLKKRHEKFVSLFLLAIIGFLLVSSPYLIYLRKETRKWTLSQKWDTARYDIGSLRRLSEDNKFLPADMGWHLGNFHLLELKGKTKDSFTGMVLFKRMAENYYDLIKTTIPGILTGSLFVLLILGFWGEPFQQEKLKFNIYLISYIVFFWFVLIPFFIPYERYLLPVLPLCFVWIGKGMRVLWVWFRGLFQQFSILSNDEQRTRLMATLSIGSVIMLCSYLPELGKVIMRDKYSPELWADAIEQKKAGLWLKEHVPTPPRLMTQNHSIDFYAGNYNIRESINIPQNEWKRVLAYARYRGAQYLVINERYCEQWYPELLFLLREENIPSDLKLIYKDIGPKSGLKTLIYQILITTHE